MTMLGTSLVARKVRYRVLEYAPVVEAQQEGVFWSEFHAWRRLVELKEAHDAAVAEKNQRLEWRSTRWGPHAYDPNSKYFLLEKEDVDEFGVPPVRMMLYCRPIFHRQIEFLHDEVSNKDHLGWILGPPGTGKSTTAMAFASTPNRSEWSMTWIHVGKFMDWQCVRLFGDERRSRILEASDVNKVLMVDDKRHHVVLVDGWTAADEFIELTCKCIRWFLDSNGVKRRRLAFVCHKHSFRIDYIQKMLSESPESFEVKTMEIIFVVEQEKLNAFDFSTVTGNGLLVLFGWPQGKETDLVKLVGICGLYDLSQQLFSHTLSSSIIKICHLHAVSSGMDAIAKTNDQ